MFTLAYTNHEFLEHIAASVLDSSSRFLSGVSRLKPSYEYLAPYFISSTY